MNLSVRTAEPEIMDDLNCAGDVVARTLRELEFINKWLGGNNVTIGAFAELTRNTGSRAFRVTDVGCGSGDMLVLLHEWSKKQGVRLELTGIDANPNITALAREHCRNYPQISFQTADIFAPGFASVRTDILIGTLFFHHFTESELIRFFSQLKSQVSYGIIINDIHRHPLAYHSIRWLTQLFSKSTMVKYDAPLSVRRGFRRRELELILAEAGFQNYKITWKWAFRWKVIIKIKP